MRRKIILSRNRAYNSKMIMSPKNLKEMISDSYDDYEFVEFLWEHLSNNPNIIVGLLEITDSGKYCFQYRFVDDNKIYFHTYTLSEIMCNVRRRCGLI
jgi:hypothetical protein